MASLSNVVGALQATFGPAAEQANLQTQVVKRRRKFTPVTLAQSFIMALLAKPHAGAQEIATMAATLGVEVSPQAVEQRYTAALGKFFETLFHQMLKTVVHAEQSLAPILDRFTEVRLIDSSVIALPSSLADQYPGCGGTGGLVNAAMKLQTELDLRAGQLESIQIEPGRLTDQGTDRQHMKPKPGALRITDLGYFNLSVFARIAAAGAYFLSRTQYTVSVTIDQIRSPLIPWLGQQGSSTVDRPVEVGTQTVLPCRLIAWRVPTEIAQRRRQKLRERVKSQGRQPSETALASCDWEYLITNLDENHLSFQEAIILYRSRWQIELLFKRWKSYCQIDLLDGKNEAMTMTRLWIRLCGALIQHWLTVGLAWSCSRQVSFEKLAQLIARTSWELGKSIGNERALRELLESMKRQAVAGCRRTKSRNRPTTSELLHDPDALEYTLKMA